MRYGIDRDRSDFAPTIEQVLAQAGPELREWYEAETTRRFERFEAQRDEPVKIGDVTLEVGKWYDVHVSDHYGTVKSWRNCQYVGKLSRDDRAQFFFDRWGGKIDANSITKRDSSGLAAGRVGYGRAGITGVTEIDEPPQVPGIREATRKAREASDARYAALKAARAAELAKEG